MLHSTCYIREDATNASGEWTFAKQVTLFGQQTSAQEVTDRWQIALDLDIEPMEIGQALSLLNLVKHLNLSTPPIPKEQLLFTTAAVPIGSWCMLTYFMTRVTRPVATY